jgi:hypothetical protein
MKNQKSQIQSQSIITILFCVIISVCCFVSGYAQEDLKDKEVNFVNNVPERLNIKSKTELPIKVEVLNAEKGYVLENLRVKVTNIGEKPIYQIRLNVYVKDTRSVTGEFSFDLNYGRHELKSSVKDLANEKDIPIKTNESLILEVNKRHAKSYMSGYVRRTNDVPRNYELRFIELSFGDGSGISMLGRYEKKK